jgi:glutamate--cysteine ligase
MGFSKWIDFALDVPMYFIKRNGKYLDFTGKSFRSFLDGQLKDMLGEKPLYSDWIDHLTTIFTDVRLKSFIEMRGADGGPSYNVTALAAFWTGLLYDTEGLNSIVDLTYNWTWQETNNLNLDVCKYGLNAEFRGKKIWDLAKDILGISLLGLKNRNVRQNEHDEGIYLSPLFEMLETKKNLSTILRERYGDKRESDVQKVFEEFNFFHGFQN